MGAATIVVDFSIVTCVGVDNLGFCAEIIKNSFADNTGGAIGAVDADFEVVKVGGTDVVCKVL